MLYRKGEIFRDSKKPLQTSDGRTIFNPTSEDWAAEGWLEYTAVIEEPEIQEPREKTLEEEKQDLLTDAKNYADSLIDLLPPKTVRREQRYLVEDLIEEGLTEAMIFDDSEEYINLQDYLDYLKYLNVLEYQYKDMCRNHQHEIKLLETLPEVLRYDYTTGYRKMKEFGEL